MRRNALAVFVAALGGCGPRVDGMDDAAGSTSSAEASSSSSTAFTSSTTDLATSEGSASGNTHASSSTTEAGPTIDVDLEGHVIECEDCFGSPMFFQPCGTNEWYCAIDESNAYWLCEGVYMRVRGYLAPHTPGIDDPCGDQVLHVQDVLDARTCEPSDCGGSTCEPLECRIECSVWDQDCPRGEKCVPWTPVGGPYLGTSCVDIEGGPDAPGDACDESRELPAVDSCDVGSVCTAGVCTAQCGGSKNDQSCPSDAVCHIGNRGAVTFCLSACNPFANECAADQQCTSLGGESYFVCVFEDELPLLDPLACDDTACGANQVCVSAAVLPDCAGSACCTAACDTLAPDCGDGMTCVPLEYDPGVGVCVSA